MPRRRLSATFRPFLLILPSFMLLCSVTVQAADDRSEAVPRGQINNEDEPQVNLPEVRRKSAFRSVSRSRRTNSNDKLVQLCQETVDVTTRRMLSTEQHTPWQMMHALLGLRNDFSILHNGTPVSGLDWIAEGQHFDNEFWFEKTQHGGRAHPYSRPYAFEGHANQFVAILSMCGVELDREFGTATGTITMRQMIQHAQMTLSVTDEPTWTLWALSRYLPPTARWRNAEGEFWSIEKLVQQQTAKPMQGAPCGGTHGLFALAHARNVYLRQGRPLRGVWLQAEYKIRKYINTARMQQNSNGSLSSNYFRGRENDPDFNKRMASVGHVLEFLMLALPQEELNARWVRRAIESAARDLMDNRTEYVKCSPLYHTVNALNIYLDRVSPRQPGDVARKKDDRTTAARANDKLKRVPFSNVSQSVEVPKTVEVPSIQSNMKIDLSEGALLPVEILSRVPQKDGTWKATPEERRTAILVPADKVSQPEADLPASTDAPAEPKNDAAAEPDVTAEAPVDKKNSEPVIEEMPLTSDGIPDLTVVSEDSPTIATPVSSSKLLSVPLTVDSATAAETTNASVVPEGINSEFISVDLDPTEWISRFESESRQIFAARDAIVAAINLEKDMSVADVGSGTGLFLSALSTAVGPKGRVFAIDIAPRFVEYLEDRVMDEELLNVDVVRNDQTSLQLMKNRVDRVFVCDTYHYFENPQAMLKSIFESLRPGGELILVNVDRIPGESSEWVLNNVRDNKAAFCKEIEDAGLEFVEEIAISELTEHYVLRFRRPAAE